MGTQTDLFEEPICNSFKATILNDQLCYEVDPNKFLNKTGPNFEEDLRIGLMLFLDYNLDRQKSYETFEELDGQFMDKFFKNKDFEEAFIYVHSIGMIALKAL